MNRLHALVGWSAVVVVLGGVLMAWMDPPTTGLLHAGIFAVLAIWAAGAIVRRDDVAVPWIVLVPIACATWGVLQASLGWTVYSFETWNSVSAWLARAAIFSLAYAGFRDSTRRKRLRSALVWFGGVFSLLALLQWYAGNGTIFWIFETPHKSEVAGSFTNRDQYAVFIELLLPFALAASIARGSLQVPAAACAGLMFASVIASGSRAGAAIVCLEALVFIAAACAGRRRNYRAAGLVAASLIVCTLVGGWTYVLERFSAPDPFAYRREMLVATIDMIQSRPVTGFGLGTWPSAYPAFAVFDPPGVYMNHAHNDWAEWTSEGGLPMLGLLLVYASAAVWQARKHIWALGVLAAFAHALVDFPLQKPALACAVFFLAGVLAAATAHSAAEPGNCEWRQL